MYPSLDVPRNVVFCIPRDASRFYLQELLLFAQCLLSSAVKYKQMAAVRFQIGIEIERCYCQLIDSASLIFREKTERS
jgi:hypothetical protein